MKPVDQDRFGAPDGNCWTSCVASILEVDLASLRDLQDAFREYAIAWECNRARSQPQWDRVLERFEELGLTLVRFPAELVPKGYSIMSGPGPRGLQHSVVALDGQLSHDPHPSRDGLSGPADEYEVLLPIVRKDSPDAT